ncbi:MAG: MFS transporter [Chlamydiota bacterium]
MRSSTLQPNSSKKLLPWIIWGLCALFFLYEFLLRTALGTFQQPIMADLNLSSVKFSILSTSSYLLISGLMQIPVGLIIDRYGLKKSLLIGAVVCALSAIGMAYSTTFIAALTARLLTGLGAAFGFICLLIAVYDWLPIRNKALWIGLSQFIGTIGPMLAAGPLNTTANHGLVGWRLIFFALGMIGIALAGVIFLVVKNPPKKRAISTSSHQLESFKSIICELFSRFQPWAIALFSGFLYFSIGYLSENETKIFLSLKGFSSNFSSYMITIAWLGYAIGCPLLGFLADYVQSKKSLMTIASCCCILASVAIVFATRQPQLLGAFFLLGIGASSQSIGFAAMAEEVKPNHLAVGLSLNNGIIALTAAVSAPLIGSLIDFSKQGSNTTLSNYYFAFSFFIAMTCIPLVLALFVFKPKVSPITLNTPQNGQIATLKNE